MENVRTLTELRNDLRGKIYIYLANREICRRFLQEAEAEGYRFGTIKPTDSDGSNIIALEKHKQLSYVNFVGHMAFQCNGGDDSDGFYRIDYQKFASGDNDYFFKQ